MTETKTTHTAEKLRAPVREGGGRLRNAGCSQGEASPSPDFSVAEYGMYTLGSMHDGRGFYDAYNNMGGISVSAISAGMVLDVIGTAVGRTNSSGQSAIGEAAKFFKGAGLLEVNIGTGGVTSKIGNGGMGLVEDLYDFGKRTYDFASLKKYAETHDAAQAKAAYDAYVYGDFTQENTAARLASEKDELVFVKKDGKPENFKAETTQNGKGGRRIEMLNSGNDYMNAIQLGHEAYRNGIVGTEREQDAETYRAVRAHTEMTKRMLASKDAGGAVAALVAGNTNLQKDLAASMKGDKAFREYVDETYKSDGDYWCFKLDGSIVDDGKYYFSREVINENGESEDKKIEGSDFKGSRVVALVKAIGFDNVVSMLGKDINCLGDIPKDVIQSALGIDIDKIPSSEYLKIFEQNKDKLVGEYLMKENGTNWNSQDKKWKDGDLKIPGLGKNDSLGVIRNSKTGNYTFFTAGLDFTREDNAFSVYEDGKGGYKKREDVAYEDRNNTTTTFWMKDVFSGKDIHRETFANAFTSIDNENHKNSIVSEYFNMRLINYKSSKYGVDTVGLFSNAKTAAGNTINIKGFDGTDDKRFLYHPTDQLGRMLGCFGPMSDNGVGGKDKNGKPIWNNKNIKGTGAYYFQQQLDLYKKLGIYNGYQFNVHLKGKLK